MKYEEVVKKIQELEGVEIQTDAEIQYGRKLKLNNECIINCYDSGKVNIQGKNQDKIKGILECSTKKIKKVFVVYGHNEHAKIELEALLRRWDLEPIILDQKASIGKTIIEKLEEYSKDVGYAIVLATPDDEGKAKSEEICRSRVRQNVVLELGMFLARLGREKVAILLKEADNFEKPSDIDGLIYIPFKNKIEEATTNLIRELTRQGYIIDSSRI
ncbi:TIR domain-containing protein [Campylobacter concisus]|uniref:CD-NTase-associated protein 12/Pycsar effector protein TIR domain-containing protein n=1 Tax=Campylobacter concisus ATCC 51562 TaxID=1242969 RepID=U2F805_9BACT|nr:TIR domain-containing protein [Campylobacter concisus]ERJ26417.1 hypothetical protein ATCC51562_376 [Campylobacter concisus ATCC 51562]